jgi:lia operon protein LiaF
VKRWQIIFGIGLILLGLFALVDVLTGIDLWGLVFPLILIGIGILLILRPKLAGQDVQVQMPIFGDVVKKSAWQVGLHEIWLLIGSTRLDFSNAEFPDGEGEIRLFGFVNDITVIFPEDVGLRLSSSAFVSDFQSPQGKQERIMHSLEYESPQFFNTKKRVHIKFLGFVAEIQIKPPLI